MHQDLTAKVLRKPLARRDGERVAALLMPRGLPSVASRTEARSHASSRALTIKVLVVDEHTLFRQGIVSLLERVDQVRVVGQAGSGTAAVWLARELVPDVITMAVMSDSNSIATANELRALAVRAAIVMVTMHREWRFIERARREAGVNGYVHKQDAFEDLVYAVRAVHRGASYYSPTLARELGVTGENAASIPPLTKRECQILTLIAEGYRSQAIADKLFLSTKTIETHRRRIRKKRDLGGPADFTRYAIKMGLVQP